jgi:uncharacterized protein (DUF1015 family)
MRIHAFRALRPTPENAGRVASVPYDVVDAEEARVLAAGNPDSFLHVVRPEIDLPDGIDPHSEPVYVQAAASLAEFRERGVLEQEDEASLYVYRLQSGEHEQVGLVACCHVEDYEQDVIRKHERTRKDKEADRIRHVQALDANTGPVFLTYRPAVVLNHLQEGAVREAPLFDFRADDGVRHTIWRVRDAGSWIQAFESVRTAYIADGHHRAAAAAAAGHMRREANPHHTGAEEYNWFLAVLFPADQLRVLPYNRTVSDLGTFTPGTFLNALAERFSAVADASPVPEEPRSLSVFCGGRWTGLHWPEPDAADPVARLDVSVLQDRVFDNILGITDPRADVRLSFIGGSRGTEALESMVHKGKAAAAFSMYPVKVEEMMAIADARCIMPPKSTWFEPKLRSGLLIHLLS